MSRHLQRLLTYQFGSRRDFLSAAMTSLHNKEMDDWFNGTTGLIPLEEDFTMSVDEYTKDDWAGAEARHLLDLSHAAIGKGITAPTVQAIIDGLKEAIETGGMNTLSAEDGWAEGEGDTSMMTAATDMLGMSIYTHSTDQLTTILDGINGSFGVGSAISEPGATLCGAGRPASSRSGVEAYTLHYDASPNAYTSHTDTPGCPYHIILNRNPYAMPSAHSDTLIASLVSSAIPPVEMNRAIPHLNVEFFLKTPAEKEGASVTTQPISMDRFLQGKWDPDTATHPYLLAKWVDGVIEGEEDESFYQTAAMDVFTSPQTMNNVDRFYSGAPEIQTGDPFRPFMSIKGFTYSIKAGKIGGTNPSMADAGGTLSLILHDKSKLADIAPLVQHGAGATTRIKITYGWSHPGAGEMQRSADGGTDIYGEVLNMCKVSQVYAITKSTFSTTEAGEISIECDLKTLDVASGMKSVDITDSDSSQAEMDVVIKEMQKIDGILTSILAKNTTMSQRQRARLAPPEFLKDPSELTPQKLPAAAYTQLKAFRKKLKEIKGEGAVDAKDLANVIEMAFGDKADDQSALSEIITTRYNNYVKQWTVVLRTADPFLRARPKGMKTHNGSWVGPSQAQKSNNPLHGRGAGLATASGGYISFGKCISALVLAPLSANYPELEEIQCIFHQFNESAGACQDFNIANFPVPAGQLFKLVKAQMKRKKTVSVNKLIADMINGFINDAASPAYGISKLPRSGYSNAEKKSKALNALYGYQEEFPAPEFKLPQVHCTTEFVDSRNHIVNDGPENMRKRTILRIVFSDMQAQAMPVWGDLLAAMDGGGSMVVKARQTETLADSLATQGVQNSLVTTSIIGNAWQHHMAGAYAELESLGILAAIDQEAYDKFIKDNAISDKALKMMDQLKDNYLFINGTNTQLRDMISKRLPSLIYGSSASGIISAKMQSMSDPAEVSIAIDNINRRNDTANKPDGCPLSVVPVELTMELLGNPFFSLDQDFFVDFGTNTSLDEVYKVHDVKHTLSAGEFKTSLKFTPVSALAQMADPTAELSKVLTQLLKAAK